MTSHVDPHLLAEAVTAVSQAIVRRYTENPELEQRYLYTLEASLNHGLKDSMASFFFGHTRLFDMFAALVQSFPKAERASAEHDVSEARFFGNSSVGRSRILIRMLLNKGQFHEWLSNLRFNLTVLERFYEPWALFRTQDEMVSVGNAVDAVARLATFHFDVKDKLLNEEDYWDRFPTIVNMDIPLVAPLDVRDPSGVDDDNVDQERAPEEVKRLPLQLQWTEIIYLQQVQAMLEAFVSSARLRRSLALVKEGQALMRACPPMFLTREKFEAELAKGQGLLSEFVVRCNPNHFPQKSYATSLAQACLRKSAFEKRSLVLTQAVAGTQALIRTRTEARQFACLTRAVNDTVGLMNACDVKDVKLACEKISGAQALLLEKAQFSKHSLLVDASAKVQPMILAQKCSRQMEALKGATVCTQGIIRGKYCQNRHKKDFADSILQSQALIRANSSQYEAIRDATSLCTAIIRSRKESKNLRDKCEAVKTLQGLLRTDNKSSEYNSKVIHSQVLQAITRSNTHVLVFLLQNLACTWSESCLRTKKYYNDYQPKIKAYVQSQSMIRSRNLQQQLREKVVATRVCQDFIADIKFQKLQKKKHQEALDRAALELRRNTNSNVLMKRSMVISDTPTPGAQQPQPPSSPSSRPVATSPAVSAVAQSPRKETKVAGAVAHLESVYQK